MTAARVETFAPAWWSEPVDPPAGRAPRPPRPGVGPPMVASPGRQPAPLIEPSTHSAFCGFVAVTVHPFDRRIGQCHGCRCWLPVRPFAGRRVLAVAR